MSNFGIRYSSRKQKEIKRAIERLKKNSKESERIGPPDSVELRITHHDSDLGKEIEKKGKKAGYKQHISYFTEEGEYIIYSKFDKDRGKTN